MLQQYPPEEMSLLLRLYFKHVQRYRAAMFYHKIYLLIKVTGVCRFRIDILLCRLTKLDRCYHILSTWEYAAFTVKV
jgi:hypothetical protein